MQVVALEAINNNHFKVVDFDYLSSYNKPALAGFLLFKINSSNYLTKIPLWFNMNVINKE